MTTTIAEDAQDTRATLRAAYMLLRSDVIDPEMRSVLIDALENSNEAYVNRCEKLCEMLAEMLDVVRRLLGDDHVRLEVLEAAGGLINSPAPLRLVRTEDA